MSVAFGLVQSYEALLSRASRRVSRERRAAAAMVWLLGADRSDAARWSGSPSASARRAIAGPVNRGVAAAAGRCGRRGNRRLSLLLAGVTLRFRSPAVRDKRLALRSMLSSAQGRMAMWIAILPAIVLAAISVLAPLQQHSLGRGRVIAATRVAAIVGILVRRRSALVGPRGPLRRSAWPAGELFDGARRAVAESRWALPARIAALVLTGVLWAPLMLMFFDACNAAASAR